MWIFTPNAFLSIVADRDNPDRRLVRARCQGDIEALFPDANVFEDETTDYRYRAFLPAAEVAARIASSIQAMDYPNFKDAIPQEKEDYHNACVGVWSIMLGLQKKEAKEEIL